MKSKFNYAVGFNGSNIIYSENRKNVTELIEKGEFIPLRFSVTLYGKEFCETLIIEKENDIWFVKLENSDVYPVEISDVLPITEKVIWYSLADQKEQLRHVLFILKHADREYRPYYLSRKAAGKKLAA